MIYWQAELKNNDIVSEKTHNWIDIRSNIKSLKLIYGDKEISLPHNMEEYIQAKSASANIGSNNIEIESRYIGFKNGNNIVKVRLDEKTKNISIETNNALVK